MPDTNDIKPYTFLGFFMVPCNKGSLTKRITIALGMQKRA